MVRTYARWAFVYGAFAALFEKRSLDAALDVASIGDGEAVLEVAVGTGELFRQILSKNPRGRNAGIDLTEPMLRRARRKAARAGPPFELLHADARALPFDDASFDLVVNNNMLGLLPEASFAPILSEVRRVLRPGGRLVVVMMRRPRAGFGELLYRAIPAGLGGWRDVDVRPLLTQTGFDDVRARAIVQLGIPSDVVLARRPS